jgi:RimJ/RimL family protein N-acetyltransferase
MNTDPIVVSVTEWRGELPMLAAYGITLREPAAQDVASLVEILSATDASNFGIDSPVNEAAVHTLIDSAVRDREAGLGFTYVITASMGIVGLIQVRQLDPLFAAAEWEMTLAPSGRGRGIFLETARLVGSFVFEALGAHRLEARVVQQNGRAMSALRKIGAVHEGVVRRSVHRGGAHFDQMLWAVFSEDWVDQAISPAVHVH